MSLEFSFDSPCPRLASAEACSLDLPRGVDIKSPEGSLISEAEAHRKGESRRVIVGTPILAPYTVASGELVSPAPGMAKKIRWGTSFPVPQTTATDG